MDINFQIFSYQKFFKKKYFFFQNAKKMNIIYPLEAIFFGIQNARFFSNFNFIHDFYCISILNRILFFDHILNPYQITSQHVLSWNTNLRSNKRQEQLPEELPHFDFEKIIL